MTTMELLLVIDIHGHIDQTGLDRLRAHLNLTKQGRLGDDWDEEFGYRIVQQPGTNRTVVHLYRQFDGSWTVSVSSEHPGSQSAGLTQLRDELVRGITAAGFKATVRAKPTYDTAADRTGIASVTEAPPASNRNDAQRDGELSAEAGRLIEPIVQELAALGPANWERFTAVFAIAGPAEVAQLSFFRAKESVPVQVPVEVMGLVREHRAIAGRMSAGPWWRMRLAVDNRGQVSEQFDYGDEPFPADQLFRPEDYRADIEALPRSRVPVWLAGYIAGPSAQGRDPDEAAASAHADSGAGISEVRTDDIVPLEEAWSRWAVLAAVRAGMGKPVGAWIEPAVASYENGDGSGSTLCVLPRDRAVLSGGLWNSPLLDAAYNGAGALPALYAGAPEWVNDSVLNVRAQRGALSFCYWWHDGQWYRGGTNTFDELDDPLPVIWTDDETVDAIVREVGEDRRDQVTQLVAAANTRSISKGDLVTVLSDADADIDAAYSQLSLAGLAA